MAVTLPDNVRALLDGTNFATVATINADGSPHTSVLWITRDGDDLLFSTLRDRRKARNIARDPRVSVTVIDHANPENYVEIRGAATITEDTGRALINAVSRKYTGEGFPDEPAAAVRVVVRVRADRLAGHAVA